MVRNERQKKPFEVYHALLNNSFQGFYKVLRPERCLTLTFHNPTFMVRNATVRAGVFSGFDYEHIHHQPLGQVSAKAMLQPFGSAQGDFYLRFVKTAPARAADGGNQRGAFPPHCHRDLPRSHRQPRRADALHHPHQPSGPGAGQAGFFGTLQTGLDVKTVLEESIGKEFELVDAKLGGAAGKLWWFADKAFAARLEAVPLTERVEETVFRCLHEKGRVTFTEVWDTVAREFPNSLTSDSTSITEALEIYGRKVSGGAWMLKEEIRLHLSRHSELIALLAKIGEARGHPSGSASANSASRRADWSKKRGCAIWSPASRRALEGVKNLRPVLDMDLLWLDGNKVSAAFEVECTTTMTSGLQRGSNLPAAVPKTMVIPEEREQDFERKMKSPLFSEHFENESWRLLFFDLFRRAYSRLKDKTAIEDLLNIPPPSTKGGPRTKGGDQTVMEF